MKRIFFIAAAAAALVLASCNKTEQKSDPKPTPVSDVITGTGTIADPYVLYKPEHLKALADSSKSCSWSSRATYFAADSTCFKLGNDIDLENAEWTPIDLGIAAKTSGKKIDFNGAGHAIKNFKVSGKEQVGFFSNFAGNIYDLKIMNADVTFTGKKGGILVGQAGGGDNAFTKILRCHVDGKVTYTGDRASSDDEVSLGGLAGQQLFGIIDQCEADVELVCNGTHGAHYVGGIIGSFGKNGIPITNCITKGTFKAGAGSDAYMFGGIAGCSQKNSNTITNSISLAEISCRDMAGGIAGLLNYNKIQETCNSSAKECDVIGCIAWNKAITVSGPAVLTAAKIGAVVACGSEGDTYKNCWRNPALTGFADSEDHEKNDSFSGMPVITYNGKAATGKTASATAKAAGWDETIWDLTGDVPALKCLK